MSFIDQAIQTVSKLFLQQVLASMAAEGLGGSALAASVEIERTSPEALTVWMAEYGKYVISGRKKFAKKVPISALLKWLKKIGLQGRNKRGRFISHNSLAFAIQTSIWKNGIRGRDFIKPLLEGGAIDVAEQLLQEAITKDFEATLPPSVQ